MHLHFNLLQAHRSHLYQRLVVAGGIVRSGQKVRVLPAGVETTVKEIWTYDGVVAEAFCPQSVTVRLADDVDVSRGSMLVGLGHPPVVATELRARICWMHPRPLQAGRKYQLKHTTQTVPAMAVELISRRSMATLETEEAPAELGMNDIGEVRLRTGQPLFLDAFERNRLTGSFILIEPGTNATVAAGMVETG